jgi:restriction system protein
VDTIGSVLDVLLLAWPIWAALGVLALLRAAYYVARLRRLVRAGLTDVDRMTAEEFTDCVRLIFDGLGHAVESVQRQEHGSLLVVTVDGIRTAVHAEHSTKANLPSRAVDAVIAAQAAHNCSDAMVVTNREFTPKAREIARANDVVLCNRDGLGLILREWQESEAALDEEALDLAA